MPTKEEIDVQYTQEHSTLETTYYAIENPTEEETTTFNKQHGSIWLNHEKDMITNDYLTVDPEEGETPEEAKTRRLQEIEDKLEELAT